MADSKWRHWNGVVDNASIAPVDSFQRRLAVPICTGIIVGVLLAIIVPPFVTKHGSHLGVRKLCVLRIGIWMALAAIVTAVLTARGTFGGAKTCAAR